MSTDLAVVEAREVLAPGSEPVAILQSAIARPFKVGTSLALNHPLKPGPNEIDLPKGAAAIVNKVTPEQLLAIVASIIVTSKSATDACVRLRQEIAGWKFQDQEGKIE